jgi:hypothetical protein
VKNATICSESSKISRPCLSGTSPPNSWKWNLVCYFKKYWIECTIQEVRYTITIKLLKKYYNQVMNSPSKLVESLLRFLPMILLQDQTQTSVQSSNWLLVEVLDHSLNLNLLRYGQINILHQKTSIAIEAKT